MEKGRENWRKRGEEKEEEREEEREEEEGEKEGEEEGEKEEEEYLFLFPFTLSASSQDNAENAVYLSPCYGVSAVQSAWHSNAFTQSF